MFALLFEDDDTSSGDKASQNRATSPPLPRGSSNLSGLDNLGATCYLNALLQTLHYTPEFRDSLFRLEQQELDSKATQARKIPIELQRLFSRLLLLNQRSCSTESLTDSFGWTSKEELQQHDVQELNRILFSAIESSLVGTSGEKIVGSLYRGSLVNQITCNVCGRVSEREEDFMDLPIPVGAASSLQQGLGQLFIDVELMDGTNQYYCDGCRRKVDATKGCRLKTVPDILAFALLRFQYDFRKGERYKVVSRHSFPIELDMNPYCDGDESIENNVYELYSVVVHRGSTHGGHYFAYIRDVDCLGTWTHPDDVDVEVVTTSPSGKVDVIDYNSPIDLMKSLVEQQGGGPVKIDRLCKALQEQTGVSWNKQFKKIYGPVLKFFRQTTDVFVVEENGMISLKPELETSSEKPAKKAEVAASPPPPRGQRWFSFDDSRIRPITLKTIESAYQGKESAYMLFYRRKTLKRREEVSPSDGVPHYLIKEVTEANGLLRVQREQYEMTLNAVTLHVHLSTMYTYANDALIPKQANSAAFDLTIDRRKRLGDLKEEISKLVGLERADPYLLHKAKLVPAGLHLHEPLTRDDDISIDECDLTTGSLLFAWVDGVDSAVRFGSHCEPLLLTMRYATLGKDDVVSETEVTCGKDRPLSHFKDLASRLTCIERDHLRITHIQPAKGRVPPKAIELGAEKDDLTLAGLGLVDGDKVTVETRSSSLGGEKRNGLGGGLAAAEAARQNRLMSFVVENRCIVLNDGEQVWPVVPVTIDREESILFLKSSILNAIGDIDEGLDSVRLRIDDEHTGLGPPVRDYMSVGELGWSQGQRLVIERGKAPTSNEVCLSVLLNIGGSSLASEDFVLDRSLCVGKLLTLATDRFNLSGQEWHLCRTNWCGEETGPLDDEHNSLEDEKLKDGDTLLLREGSLPPKGYIRLLIYLDEESASTRPESSTNPLQWITGNFQGMMKSLAENLGVSRPETETKGEPTLSSDSQETCNARFIPLGDVEISKQATLSDLKAHVLTLPLLDSHVIPTLNFLRLRQLDDDQELGRVLRRMDQSLSRLKVTSSTKLCLTILNREEILSQSAIVLTVRLRLPEKREYGPPIEVIFDTSESPTPTALRKFLSETLELPLDRLVVAKHFPNKFEWAVIRASPTQETKVKGKKKGGQAKKRINLRQSPYFLKDGDVIGIQLVDDRSRDVDFSTPSDDVGKATLRALEEEKRQRRRQRSGAGDGTNRRAPEVGIKIFVPDYGTAGDQS
ncbi:ubiquitin carboxyl-terminal hydrolase 40-like [Oscarella lobularis]|uniref:ubiquitin carboxyl-terminal hydrolase 40-like n=1 Tax=Oscarella lobularis TaxID=121494 RepID=UPI00331365CE